MTPERYQRITEVLARRQTDLTVCVENVHKPHNVSAVVRTCDAVGIDKIHGTWTEKSRLAAGYAKGSQQWVEVEQHHTIEDATTCFKKQGMQILVTNLSDTAVDFREIDYTKPTAIILGQEKHGATPEAIKLADQDIVIPMLGMVQSLNVSVAAAVILYEAQRQRALAGFYQRPSSFPEETRQTLLFEHGHPQLAKQCRKKSLPYPVINDSGEIEADDSWWSAMKSTGK
jgi:tRNA (guanosine-2'-O-)-methyltransferase